MIAVTSATAVPASIHEGGYVPNPQKTQPVIAPVTAVTTYFIYIISLNKHAAAAACARNPLQLRTIGGYGRYTALKPAENCANCRNHIADEKAVTAMLCRNLWHVIPACGATKCCTTLTRQMFPHNLWGDLRHRSTLMADIIPIRPRKEIVVSYDDEGWNVRMASTHKVFDKRHLASGFIDYLLARNVARVRVDGVVPAE